MKVAIYARYSSDNQRDASIADQLRVCRAFAERQGWAICEEYTDHAVSGATLLRAGFQALMRDALNRRFDVVLAESLDRFSRDQEDTAGLFKRLTFAGVNIVTLAEGDITHLHIGFKGTMNALFLKDLAEKTHRGLRGRIEDGKSAGGLCYGYRVVKALNAGTVTTGEREIDPEQAAVVERIFRDFVAGVSPKQIAKDAESRRRRRSVRWRLESEHDSRQRQARNRDSEQRAVHRPAGLEPPALREESRHRKARVASESGERVDREGRSRAAHRADELWAAAKQRQAADAARGRGAPAAIGAARRPQYLFSGLTKCGVCGAGFIMIGQAPARVLRRPRPGAVRQPSDHPPRRG